MAEGTIRSLVSDRGFGFIRPTLTNGTMRKDLFFHASQVVGVRYEELREDDTVRYTQEDDPHGRGPVAVGVERIKRATPVSGEAQLPNDPVSGRWPTATDHALDEDNVYDWDEAG